MVLDRLLDAGNVAAQAVVATLNLAQLVVEFGVVDQMLLDLGVNRTLLRDRRLDADIQLADGRLLDLQLVIQCLPAQRIVLRGHGPFLLLELAIFLGGLRLSMQMLKLASELVAQVGQPLQVLAGTLDAVLGLAAALFVFGDSGGVLDEKTQIFGSRLNQPRHHALFDDGVTARAQPGAKENIGDVAAAALDAVEHVPGLAVAGHFALDGNLVVLGIFALDAVVAVVKHQLDAGLPHWFAPTRTVENNVGHVLAAQVLRRAFPHHPAHGIDDVGFAAAIGPDHRTQIAGKIYRSGINEGLETG